MVVLTERGPHRGPQRQIPDLYPRRPSLDYSRRRRHGPLRSTSAALPTAPAALLVPDGKSLAMTCTPARNPPGRALSTSCPPREARRAWLPSTLIPTSAAGAGWRDHRLHAPPGHGSGNIYAISVDGGPETALHHREPPITRPTAGTSTSIPTAPLDGDMARSLPTAASLNRSPSTE